MTRKNYTKDLKFKVAMEALRGDLTMAQIVSKYEVSQSLIHRWRTQLLDSGSEVFSRQGIKGSQVYENKEKDRLHAKIGQLTVERDFLEKALCRLPRRSAKK